MLQILSWSRFNPATWAGFILLVVAWPCAAADWPMRGRDQSRNPVVTDGQAPTDWELPTEGKPGRHVRWSAELGTVSHGDPVISGGLVWVGTNNGRPRDPLQNLDAGVLMCFDESNGSFLYQYVSPRLPEGRDVDWPLGSQSATPLIEGDRLWFCNSRCEVICLDIGPLLKRTGPPQPVWKLDMRGQLGVVPQGVMIGCNTAQCSIAGYQGLIYVNTTNAAGPRGVAAPDAPSLLCLEKDTGRVQWQDNSPGENLVDVSHGSPLVAEVEGRAQVIMGQGDGWLRGIDALTGEVLWKFDIDPKWFERARPWQQMRWIRNELVAMPVLHDGRIYFATGKHHECGLGPGRICCLDPTKVGDISSEVASAAGEFRPNPNSGLIWEYSGPDAPDPHRLNRTLASVAIHRGLIFLPDLKGILHCVDAATGKGVWTHDLEGMPYSSALIVGNQVYVGTDEGLFVFELSRQKKLLARHTLTMESTPAFANGTLFLMGRLRLFAVGP